MKIDEVINVLHGSYYSAEYIFPDFPEQNELFSLTNLFMRNTNAGFQSLAITLETRAAEQIKSKSINNLRAKRAEKILNCCMQCACNSSVFSASLLTFAPWYF